MAKKTEVMKLSVKTTKFQEMVTRAIKGAGNKKVLPITQMLAIRLEKGVLSLITTDATNTLYIRETGVEGSDFYAVVPVDQFSRLVSRTTSDSITLKVNKTVLEFTGNGKYSIPIQFDDDDMTVVQFPDPLEEVVFDPNDTIEINNSTITKILNFIKPALAVTMENPFYTGYYAGEKVIATDTFLINILDVDLFHTPKLISPQVMELLSVMTAEKINVDLQGNIMVFGTPDCTVYGRDLEGIEEYAVDDILEFAQIGFDSMCKLPKNALLQLLDRLSLFVMDYDNGGIYLTFTKDGMQVSSMSSSGVEVIPYTESKNFQEFSCLIEVGLLTKQVKTQIGETVELWYGVDSAIKMVDGNVTQIIGLLEENDTE